MHKNYGKKAISYLIITIMIISCISFAGCDSNQASNKNEITASHSSQPSPSAIEENNDTGDDADNTKIKDKPTQAAVSTDKAVKEKSTKEKRTKSSPGKKSSDTVNKKEKNKEDKTKKNKKEKKSKKPTGKQLTVKSNGKTTTYYLSEIKEMGLVSYRYSYRNKDSSKRQFDTWTGIKLTTLLSKAGASGSKVRLISNDGFAKEYSLNDLKTNKYSFKKTVGDRADSVPAIISTDGEGYYRLCFGQRADDTDDSGDYNMQHWAKWIVTIEVY